MVIMQGLKYSWMDELAHTGWQVVGHKKGHNWTEYDVAEQSDYYGDKI